MKKVINLFLAAVMMLSLAACGSEGGTQSTAADEGTDGGLKIGVILIGDENEGYSYAHISGIKEAAANLGIPDENILWKYSVSEDAGCYDAAMDLVDAGCKLVISNSYGHQTYMQQAAQEVPDVTFVSMTGDTASVSGLPNFKNAFTKVFQSRYVSGVVAGMKIAELDAQGAIPEKSLDADGNVRIGYVGAYPYAEVVSGYTAFYLGAKSVYDKLTMEVSYTNSWSDLTAEAEAANALLSDGCIIIGQHADSTGAPSAVQAAYEKGETVFSVGYNVDMLSVAPDAALTSAANNWSVYYTYAIGAVLNGEEVATNWAAGYESDAVRLTQLGPNVAAGTAEKVAEVEEALGNGSLQVFDTDSFTVDGKKIEDYTIDLNGDYDTDDEEDQNAIWDGYFHESEFRAAPSFDIRIDGIIEKN